MPSDLFSNASSAPTIPDSLWRPKSSGQRKVDAAELWDRLSRPVEDEGTVSSSHDDPETEYADKEAAFLKVAGINDALTWGTAGALGGGLTGTMGAAFRNRNEKEGKGKNRAVARGALRGALAGGALGGLGGLAGGAVREGMLALAPKRDLSQFKESFADLRRADDIGSGISLLGYGAGSLAGGLAGATSKKRREKRAGLTVGEIAAQGMPPEGGQEESVTERAMAEGQAQADQMAQQEQAAAQEAPPAQEAAPAEPAPKKPKAKAEKPKDPAGGVTVNVHTSDSKSKDPQKPAEKKASMPVGASLGGMAAGFYPGKALAKHTANVASPRGEKTKAQDIAHKAAILGAPLGGLGALYMARRHHLPGRAELKHLKHFGSRGAIFTGNEERALLQSALPAIIGLGGTMAGGALTGAAVAGGAHVKHRLGKRKKAEKKAAAPGTIRAATTALGALGGGAIGGAAQYQKSKAREGGKSREELSRAASLSSLAKTLKNEGGSSSKANTLKTRFARMQLEQATKNKNNPRKAALLAALPAAVAGGGVGYATGKALTP